MKLIRIIMIFFVTGAVLFSCTPPPENLPEKEEVYNNMKIKGGYTKDDMSWFFNFFAEMQKAVNGKDTAKAISYYSRDFGKETGIKLADMKKNLEYVNKTYTKIDYKMNDLKVQIKGDFALTEDIYTYNAVPVSKKLPALQYKGKERIYWKKESGTWKIVDWVYEE